MQTFITTAAHPSLSDVQLPHYRGPISVTSNGRYFQDEAGRGFIVIGHNDAITWPGLETLLDDGSPDETEGYVRDLRAHGITVSRIMLEYAQHARGYLEKPVGVFSPKLVNFWDQFFPIAERHGLYLLLTPYDTFWQVKRWRFYPYNARLGGPTRRKCDWLLAKPSIDAQKARWDFVIRRWGGSPNIFAWDLMNEIDLYWDCTPDQLYTYIADMAHYVRDLEMRCWGRQHMLTVSTAVPVPDGMLGEVIYNHPDLDFANTHLYMGPGVMSPTNTIEGAVGMARGVQKSLAAIRYPRPYFDSESGPIDAWIQNRALDQEYHRYMSFAHLAAGGAGSGMRWPYCKPHHLLPPFQENLLSVARFAAAVDWANFDSQPISDRIHLSDETVIRVGCADSRTAILWLLRDKRSADARPLDGLTVQIDGVLQDGAYIVELWETRGGCEFARLLITVMDGRLHFSLQLQNQPLDDVAILVRPLRAA